MSQELALKAKLYACLSHYETTERELKGINTEKKRRTFVQQLTDSNRRTRYIHTMVERKLSPDRANPQSDLFDPLRGAIVQYKKGDIDEACWLVFQAIHFGKNSRSGWKLSRAVYGNLGSHPVWSWQRVSHNVEAFTKWISANEKVLREGPPKRGFGNHRKYESLRDLGGTGHTGYSTLICKMGTCAGKSPSLDYRRAR